MCCVAEVHECMLFPKVKTCRRPEIKKKRFTGLEQTLLSMRSWETHLASVNLKITESHRITECSGLEGTSVGHLVQPPCRSRVTYSRLHRTASRRVLNISREGDSTASLGSLFQCSITLRGKKFFLMFRRNFLCFSLCPLPLVLKLLEHGYPDHVFKTQVVYYIKKLYSVIFNCRNFDSEVTD